MASIRCIEQQLQKWSASRVGSAPLDHADSDSPDESLLLKANCVLNVFASMASTHPLLRTVLLCTSSAPSSRSQLSVVVAAADQALQLIHQMRVRQARAEGLDLSQTIHPINPQVLPDHSLRYSLLDSLVGLQGDTSLGESGSVRPVRQSLMSVVLAGETALLACLETIAQVTSPTA